MGEFTLMDKIRGFIAGIAFDIFLWASSMTADEYFTQIYEQEHSRYRSPGKFLEELA